MSIKPIRMLAVGDIMPGDSATCVGWGMASRWPGLSFERALDAIRRPAELADIVFGNLEAPLTSEGEGATDRARDQMRADVTVATSLREVGITVVSVSNNHAMQHGLRGFHSTVDALRANGIAVAGLAGTDGWCSDPVVIDVRSQAIGLLSYCWRPRQYYSEIIPPFAEGSLEQVVRDVGRLREHCSSVVVSVHWGDEFVSQPSESQVLAARAIIDAGATVVIGHHPHTLQPIERYRDCTIAYSLGNFVSDMLWLPEARRGAWLELELVHDGSRLLGVQCVETSSDYRAVVIDGVLPSLVGDGMSEVQYIQTVREALARQRRLAYGYTIRRLHRFRPAMAVELLVSTLGNKLSGVLGRGPT